MKHLTVNQQFRLIFAVIAVLFGIALVSGIQADSQSSAAANTLAQIQSDGSIEPMTDTNGGTILVIVFSIGFLAIGLVADIIRDHFRSPLVMMLPMVALMSVACIGTNSLVTVDTNETVFVIDVVGGDEGAEIDNTVQTFWEDRLQPNTQEFSIEPYCWKANASPLTPCEWRDSSKAIVANTVIEISVDWDASTPVIGTDGSYSYPNAFCSQSIEGHRICVGAEILLRISNAPLYLSKYGTDTVKDGRGRYPARSLESVGRSEIEALMQSKLNRELSSFTRRELLVEINDIFDRIGLELSPILAEKGIEIVELSFQDGIQYVNPQLQAQLDNEAQQQANIVEARSLAEKAEIENQTNLDNAYAQATQTAVAVLSDVDAKRQLGEVDIQYPGQLSRELIAQWDGQFPMIIGGNGGSAESIWSFQQLMSMLDMGATIEQPVPVATPSS